MHAKGWVCQATRTAASILLGSFPRVEGTISLFHSVEQLHSSTVHFRLAIIQYGSTVYIGMAMGGSAL